MDGLAFGPVPADAVHVCVDMQLLFATGTEWASPAVDAVAPFCARIAAHAPERTIFTRFVTPERADDMPGAWQRYYRRWHAMTQAEIDPALLELVPALRRFVPPARAVDKLVHGAFELPAFLAALDRLAPSTLVFTGVETDVCVLASVVGAVDRGYRTIVVADAVGSSSVEGHRTALDAIYPRFDQQIEITTTDAVLAAWPR